MNRSSILKAQVAAYERQLIERVLAKNPNRREAAKALGISRRSLYYKLRQPFGALPTNPDFTAGVNHAIASIEQSLLRPDIRELAVSIIRNARHD